MSRLLEMTLGVMTAIGGFVDIGNLVTGGITGARFGASLTWAIVLGTIGMTLYGEMAGRVAFVLLSGLTLAAELGGVALVLQLVTGVRPEADRGRSRRAGQRQPRVPVVRPGVRPGRRRAPFRVRAPADERSLAADGLVTPADPSLGPRRLG